MIHVTYKETTCPLYKTTLGGGGRGMQLWVLVDKELSSLSGMLIWPCGGLANGAGNVGREGGGGSGGSIIFESDTCVN